MKNLAISEGYCAAIQTSPEGYPLIASYSSGSHAYSGEVLLPSGRVRYCPRTHATREIRESDRVFDSCGRLYPVSSINP